MKARTAVGDSTGHTRFVLPAMIVFLISSMLFSGILFAQTEAEVSAEPAVVEEAQSEAEAELEALLKKNKKCLRCHSKERVKTLEDGQDMSLQIHSEEYIDSAHGETACVSCHTAIGDRRHPSKKTNITISNQREYSLEMNESCRNCHDAKFTQYEGSIHSSMVGQGSTEAPLCTDCHSAHAVETMTVYQPDTGFPCKKCHENIFTAYRESVHGSARIEGNVIRDDHIQAPICSDCHHSHDVTPVEIGDTLRSACLGCHENVPLLHSQWLPNAGTHLDIVSCAVCHAPFAKHRFDLHLFDKVTQAPVSQQAAADMFQDQIREIEETGGDLDPLTVFKLIEESNDTDLPDNVSLRGRMEVKSGVWAHQIASKSFAVRTCDSCHLDGTKKALNVTVSVPGEDGRVQRFETDREELSAVGAADSIKTFFLLGGNKNKFLDILVLLSLISGFAIPIGHFTLGRMIKEKMGKGEG